MINTILRFSALLSLMVLIAGSSGSSNDATTTQVKVPDTASKPTGSSVAPTHVDVAGPGEQTGNYQGGRK